MHQVILATHNVMRWIVVLAAVVALVRAYLGWLQGREWTAQDRRVNMIFAVSMDIQLLLGLILYFFTSPLTQQFLNNFGGAMDNPTLRFFGLEHTFYMLLAVVLVHIGSARARRADEPTAKHRAAAIFFTLAVLFVVLGMPWSRPLLPGL